MYPFGSLPDNLVAFADVLRRRHGFRLGPREVGDAARALAAAPIADEHVVRDLLRPILSHTYSDVMAFDRAFDEFFHPSVRPADSARPGRTRKAEVPGSKRRRVDGAGQQHAESDSVHRLEGFEASETETDAADGEVIEGQVLLRYSPLDAEGPSPRLFPPDAAWQGAARALVKRLETGLSRRWRPAVRGRRFDLRRTLRGSLHTGGEAVQPRWRSRIRKRPRLVVLVDGSRSMGEQARHALQLAVALASATRNIEVYVFSTALERVTRDVRLAARGEPRMLPRLTRAWGGGTSIGGSLRAFLTRYADRTLGPDTVAIIASDGLDVGQPGLLREAMARIHRRTAGIIWLNPLVETEGYEPKALGMSVARPLVTTLAWASDAAGLLQLSRTVRVRR